MVKKPTYEELEQKIKDLEKETAKLKTTELAFRKSARRLKTLLDFVPYPIVVFDSGGRVTYLNSRFTEIFGWTFKELEGDIIPFVPPSLKHKTSEGIKRLFEKKVLMDQETKRLTKNGRILDVVIRVSYYSGSDDEPSEVLAILRDITQEKRIARNNEALLGISMALPEYPDLEKLLDYTSAEIKRLIGTEGALVILLDDEKNELFFKAAAYDDSATEKRMKEIRFPADKGISGKVIRTGEPVIVSDTSRDPNFYSVVDIQSGFKTRNMLDVPLKSKDRTIGVLCAINKKTGVFDKTDIELLNMIAGTVALSIDNARFSDELKDAYKEVTSLNRAKDKVINHLSHELKTPVSILLGSTRILSRSLTALPEKMWKNNMERINRNLDRIVDIQYEVEDIMQNREHKSYNLFSLLLDQCTDELNVLIAEETGETGQAIIAKRVKKRIEEIFGPKDIGPDEVFLNEYIRKRIEKLKPLSSHRQVEIIFRLDPTPPVYIPITPLQKVLDGLVKNAIENTPDEGKIEVATYKKGEGVELAIRDYGIGITEDAQRRIFEGFFTTQDTMAYSSKKPFDFNAGGKGADLLRMKIFSERYNFKIDMKSSRCRFIPKGSDICPGMISKCESCKRKEDCYDSGGTTFFLYFPPDQEHGQA